MVFQEPPKPPPISTLYSRAPQTPAEHGECLICTVTALEATGWAGLVSASAIEWLRVPLGVANLLNLSFLLEQPLGWL